MQNSIKPSPLIQEFENFTERGLALEIGAGRGDNALYISQKGFAITAIEINEEAVNTIEQRAKELGLPVRVLLQDIRDFNFEKESYAFISAMNSLNFVSKEEFMMLINRIKDGLKIGGISVIALFTTNDPIYEDINIKTDGTFENKLGKKWYFPRPGELRTVFEKDFDVLFFVEAVVDDPGHPGHPDPHKHAVARIVVQKKSVCT